MLTFLQQFWRSYVIVIGLIDWCRCYFHWFWVFFFLIVISIFWRILVFYPEPETSMNYFDSDMSKSTNTIVYFDWKTVIYIYACGIYRTQFMLPNWVDDNSSTCTFTTGKSVTCTGACANEIYTQSTNRSLVHKAKEGRHVIIVFFF